MNTEQERHYEAFHQSVRQVADSLKSKDPSAHDAFADARSVAAANAMLKWSIQNPGKPMDKEKVQKVMNQDFFRLLDEKDAHWSQDPVKLEAESQKNEEALNTLHDSVTSQGIDMDSVVQGVKEAVAEANMDQAPKIADQSENSDKDEEEEDDDFVPEYDEDGNLINSDDAKRLHTRMSALSLMVRSAPTKREQKMLANKNLEKAPKKEEDKKGITLGFPKLKGFDPEAFVRNRRFGQLQAAAYSISALDALNTDRKKAGTPEEIEKIDQKMRKHAKSLLKNCQRAFDAKGIDLMEKGGADKAMILDTMEQMNVWTKQLHSAKLDEDKSVWSSAWDKLVTSVKSIFSAVSGKTVSRGPSQMQ